MIETLLFVLLAFLPAAWLVVRFIEWKYVFEPTRTVQSTPAAVGLEYEEIDFVSEDGNPLHGWWIPHPDAIGSVLYCHGNGGNLGDRVHVVEALSRLGVHVFAFDYRGYGRSRGIPTERGAYRDARAAFEVVRNRYGDVEDPPVLLFGRSLGGAVAIHLAGQVPVRGLVVEGCFTSIRDMARLRFPQMPLPRLCVYGFDARAGVRKLSMPKIIAHSADDEKIPFQHGEALFDAAPDPKRFVRLRGGHDELGWTTTSGYWDMLQRFCREVLSSSRPAPL